MDVPLLRILQFMKRLEDNPSNEFETGRIDLETFTPKYSRVVVVDQRVDESLLTLPMPKGPGNYGFLPPGLLPNIGKHFIFNSLSLALELLSYFSFQSDDHVNYFFGLESEEPGWTVILKEGLYINQGM